MKADGYVWLCAQRPQSFHVYVFRWFLWVNTTTSFQLDHVSSNRHKHILKLFHIFLHLILIMFWILLFIDAMVLLITSSGIVSIVAFILSLNCAKVSIVVCNYNASLTNLHSVKWKKINRAKIRTSRPNIKQSCPNFTHWVEQPSCRRILPEELDSFWKVSLPLSFYCIKS